MCQGQVQRWIQPQGLNARQAPSYVGFRVYWGHLLLLAVEWTAPAPSWPVGLEELSWTCELSFLPGSKSFLSP